MKDLYKYGTNQVLTMRTTAKVLTVHGIEEIQPWHIEGLSNGEIIAVHVKNAVSEFICKLLVNHAKTSQQLSSYSVEPGFKRNAQTLPLFESSHNMREYFAGAREANWNAFSGDLGFTSPTNSLRIHLDNVWPHGANLLRLEGRICPFGLSRAVQPGSNGVKAHQDMPHWDFPSVKFESSKSNISVVHYVSDFQGGQTNIYPFQIRDRGLYDSMLEEGSEYGLDESLLPDPIAKLEVEKTDAVLFNARFAHSVDAVPATSDARHTLSGFILHTPNHKLEMFI